MKLDENLERHLLSMYKPGEMTLKETQDARYDAGKDNKDWQRLLALEDRRSAVREITRDNPLLGVPMGLFLAPGEMAVKGVDAGIRELGFDGVYKYPGRSGFFDPLANIGAGFTGLGQGLMDFFKDKFGRTGQAEMDALNDLVL